MPIGVLRDQRPHPRQIVARQRAPLEADRFHCRQVLRDPNFRVQRKMSKLQCSASRRTLAVGRRFIHSARRRVLRPRRSRSPRLPTFNHILPKPRPGLVIRCDLCQPADAVNEAQSDMNIALIGPSGVGKGTHAAGLAKRFRMRHVATGELLRHHLETNSPLGARARKYMKQGELVPDELVESMIEEACDQVPADEGLLLDGFPRTVYQARFLDALFASRGRRLDAVVCLHLPDEQVVGRLAGRLICRQCQTSYHEVSRPPRVAGRCDSCGGELFRRADDTSEVVSARLRVFHRATGPLLDHYAASKRLLVLSGEGEADHVAARLFAALDGVAVGTAAFTALEEVLALTGLAPPKRLSAQTARRTADIVLLGGPGSGKGTQAERLSKELRLPHLATGDLFRENLLQATELGQLAKTYMDRGELVPDDVTEAMVEKRIAAADASEGFILDGFPRTMPQVHALTEMLTRQRRRLGRVLYIKVSDEELVARLSGRLICRQCQAPYHKQFNPPRAEGICDSCGGALYQRDDDNPVTVRARLVTFHAQTEPLIEFYSELGLLQTVDGEGDVAEVHARCRDALRSFGSEEI